MGKNILFLLLLLSVNTSAFSQAKVDSFLKKCIKTDSVYVDKLIKGFEPKIKDSPKDVIYNWDDVIDSMRSRYKEVHRINETCPHCHRNLYSIWFSSPAWTWEQMCGTAGNMKLCVFCPKQIEYECAVQN